MPDIRVKNDSEKAKELQTSLLKLKEGLGGLNQSIQQAIQVVSTTWKDFQFNNFKESYKNYINGIKKFEQDLESCAKETLPPIIKHLEEIEGVKIKEN